jgi:Ca-activated chloride channel homolog
MELIAKTSLEQYTPAILLMTDGKSEGSFERFAQAWKELQQDIPVFSVMFGEAEEAQLKNLANLTRGRVFDGRSDLVKAFRTAKGYN